MARLFVFSVLLLIASQAVAFNLLGLISALLEPKCPSVNLLEGACTCELVKYRLHYECDMTNSTGFWTNMDVIYANGGSVGELSIKNCKDALGELYKNIPFIKVRTLKIKNCGITSIPKRAFHDSSQWIDELDLSHNEISSVDFGVHQLPYLKKLDLSHNRIATVPNAAFKYSDKLKELDLSHNRISHFSPDAFEKPASKLKMLDLSYNHLESLPSHTFSSREAIVTNEGEEPEFIGFTHLKKLNLNNNRIRSVGQYAFGSLPELSSLKLSNNQLVDLQGEAFGSLPDLKELSMDHNLLKTIGNIPFMKMANLRQLRLQSNAIQKVESGLFADNQLMWELNLSHNNITEIPINAFEGLYVYRLKIENNPMSDLHSIKWELKMSELRRALTEKRLVCPKNKMTDGAECENSRMLRVAKDAGL